MTWNLFLQESLWSYLSPKAIGMVVWHLDQILWSQTQASGDFWNLMLTEPTPIQLLEIAKVMKNGYFFLFLSLQRAQKVSLYTVRGFKSRQIPRGRSLQNIMTIAHELARKFGKKLPPPICWFWNPVLYDFTHFFSVISKRCPISPGGRQEVSHKSGGGSFQVICKVTIPYFT